MSNPLLPKAPQRTLPAQNRDLKPTPRPLVRRIAALGLIIGLSVGAIGLVVRVGITWSNYKAGSVFVEPPSKQGSTPTGIAAAPTSPQSAQTTLSDFPLDKCTRLLEQMAEEHVRAFDQLAKSATSSVQLLSGKLVDGDAETKNDERYAVVRIQIQYTLKEGPPDSGGQWHTNIQFWKPTDHWVVQSMQGVDVDAHLHKSNAAVSEQMSNITRLQNLAQSTAADDEREAKLKSHSDAISAVFLRLPPRGFSLKVEKDADNPDRHAWYDEVAASRERRAYWAKWLFQIRDSLP